MNNCHGALVWLLVNKPKPVNRPIRKITILGPYLSRAQPPIKANDPQSNRLIENIADVAARVNRNSFSMDLKKMPKEFCIPIKVAAVIKKIKTITQP